MTIKVCLHNAEPAGGQSCTVSVLQGPYDDARGLDINRDGKMFIRTKRVELKPGESFEDVVYPKQRIEVTEQ